MSALPTSLPYGASPKGDWPADIAGREAFLQDHIFLHTHIPKTGGSTLAHALSSMVGGTQSIDLRLKRSPLLADVGWRDRARLRMVSGHFVWGVHRGFSQTPLYIAAVREPVARAVSYYGFIKRNPDMARAPDLTDRTFEEAWELLGEDPARQQSNEQSRFLCGLKVEEQADREELFRQLDDGYLLVMPMEKIRKGVSYLRAALGLPNAPLANVNTAPDPAPEISPAMRSTIEQANELDAEMVEKITKEFPERIERAAAYIAQHCIRPPEDAKE